MAREWVLIRGIVSEQFHWRSFPAVLHERFPRDGIHAADILGNGRHHARATPLDVRANVDWLRAQVPTPRPKTLIGFSLGAMLALEWAHARPREVAGLVLINPSLNDSPPHHRLRPGAFKEIVLAALETDGRRREERILRLTTGLGEGAIREIAPSWAERGARFPAGPAAFVRQILLAARIAPRRLPPPAPVLILNSGRDRVVDPRCSARIARRWGLPLTVHPEAGHDLTLEDPGWAADRIADWARTAAAEGA